MDRGRDGVRETMATGLVIYELSLEIAGSSTSVAKAWSSTGMDVLSREEIRAKEQRSARFGTGSRRKKSEEVLEKKIER